MIFERRLRPPFVVLSARGRRLTSIITGSSYTDGLLAAD
jgi:hypothetical protein